ncbi:hypothetical protein PV10_04502 [Exophiala mesophila]|uniref:Micro-fibrillar-associated protein 1 C-terminal domain-containing protein n=1 Tax=Exophiala mesophila TaxID=212818 RepID=A0A0D1XYE5_EXOME|nr:uncharacterized protein PV10_04502 [Exophiala mesophila]KIV93276.1 hypothetical protein PV10_04502 [Exophiala mesophila]
MPPPMPNPSKRMTANPAKPVGRYRPGKAVAEQESSDEESEESEQEQVSQPQKRLAPRQPPSRPTQSQTRQPVESDDDDDDDDDDEEGFVTDPEDDVTQPAVATGSESRMKQSSQSTPTLPNQKSTAVTQRSKPPDLDAEDLDQGSESEEESEDESEESSEESSSSEDEAPQRKFQRPTFIKKSDRLAPPAHKTDQPTANDSNTPAPPSHSHSHSHSPSISTDPSQQDSARRLAQAELLIKDKLERDAAARLLGKKAWDDDDDLDPDSLVDDTDNLDPAAEYAAWKLRELQRLKRDREAMIAREKEIEEIERRRNLTAEEREREDAEFINNQKQEKEANRSATEAQYMARYHHKGAFFQGDEAAEILKRRDIMGAKFEDQVSDKSLLPEYMQLRDMTKLGKKGRTRYTDLKGQDTGRFGDDVKKWRGSSDYRGGGVGGGGRGQGDIDTRGLDERFLPDRDRGGPSGGRSNPSGPTGANASSIGGGGGRKNRDRGGARSRSRERSHSPRRRRPSRSQSPESRKRRRHVDDDYRDRDQDRDRDRRRPVSP